MLTYHGPCHCGAVRIEVSGEISEAYTCDCSLCSKKNALMANVHDSRLTVTAGEDVAVVGPAERAVWPGRGKSEAANLAPSRRAS